jgi:tellurite resistance protein TerC
LEIIDHTGTPFLYLGFSLLVVVMLAIDFLMLKAQGSHRVSVQEAALWSVVWFIAAMAFAGWFWWHLSGTHGRGVAD